MKKFFSIGLGLFAGILLWYTIGYVFTTSSAVSASSYKTRQFGGNKNFGSGSKIISGVLDNGNFTTGNTSGRNTLSGATQSKRENRKINPTSAESILSKDLSQK